MVPLGAFSVCFSLLPRCPAFPISYFPMAFSLLALPFLHKNAEISLHKRLSQQMGYRDTHVPPSLTGFSLSSWEGIRGKSTRGGPVTLAIRVTETIDNPIPPPC